MRNPILGAIRRYKRRQAVKQERAKLRSLLAGNSEAGKHFAYGYHLFEDGFTRSEEARLAAIEQERARMLADHSPLEIADRENGTVAMATGASKTARMCRLLYAIVSAYKPKTVLEMGTNVGISSAYIAAALRAVNNGGEVWTMEGSAERLAQARQVHSAVDLNVWYVEGMFDEMLDSALEQTGPVDFAFIDGNHHYEPTLAYFEKIFAHSTANAVFVFDDIRWSDGMERAWNEVSADDRFDVSIDLGRIGICARESALNEKLRVDLRGLLS